MNPDQIKRLFDTIRKIKGGPLTQADVSAVNAVLSEGLSPAPPVGGRRASQKGIDLIHAFESLRLTTYRDPGPTGLPITGGWGSTRNELGKPFVLGQKFPKEYWDALFRRDLADTEDFIAKKLGDAPVTQNQFDAMVSLAYNIGTPAFGKSTLLKLHLSGNYAGAKAEFPKWNKSNGKVLPGLVRRRADEAALYAS